MKYNIAHNYIGTLESIIRKLSEMPYKERHPEPLAYEEIQAMASEVNALDIMKLYGEAVNADNLNIYKGQFSDILTNPLVTCGTARKRITLLPYYPAGITLTNYEGNKVLYSIEDNKLIGTETNAEGEAIAIHEIVSYLFDGEEIVKRLQEEGRDANYIIFSLSQLNQLQEGVFDRWEDVRIMFDFLEKQNLKKYKNVLFDTHLLEREKEKPQAWKRKPNEKREGVTFEEISSKANFYKTSELFLPTKTIRGKDIFAYLSEGGYSANGGGCLRDGVDVATLTRALEGCVMYDISNFNRMDILYFAFQEFAKRYIHATDRAKYMEDLNKQVAGMGQISESARKLYGDLKKEITLLLEK